MKTLHNRIALLALALSLLPAVLYAQRGKAASGSAPQQAAQLWLALVDSKRYDSSWDAAAKSFQKAVTKAQWASAVTSGRQPFGTFKSRRLLAGKRMTQIPGSQMPPGTYALLQYQATYSQASGIETVVLEQNSDKKWRVNGYFIRPTR